jgi:hypothetical protein
MAIFWKGGSSRGCLPVFRQESLALWMPNLLDLSLVASLLRSGIVLLSFCMLAQLCRGQLQLNCWAAPSVQTITLQEATITQGYRPMLGGEGGLRLRYDFANGFGLRLGGGFLTKGANLEVEADSLGGHSAGLAALRAFHGAILVGAEYRSALNARLSLSGSLDIVLGKLINSKVHMIEGTGTLVYKDFFLPEFAGMDLGLALQYQLSNGMGFRFSPTLELQINYAYRSSFFKPKFVGFAPRMEFYLSLNFQKR